MSFGGGSPYPRVLGDDEDRIEVLRAAISQDRGDAYSNDPNSIVYLENLAIAYEIDGAWGTNERLSNLWNPQACSPTDIERWERIMALPRTAKDTLQTRRDRVQARMTFQALGLRGVILQAMAPLGASFYDIEYIDVNSAYVATPDASYPFGTQDPLTAWSSTVAHILIRLVKPTSYTEGDFSRAVAQALEIIDPYLPAWVSVDWYRAGPVFTAGGGLSGAGFYADDASNTDYEILDS